MRYPSPINCVNLSEPGEGRSYYMVSLSVPELVELRIALLSAWRDLTPTVREIRGCILFSAYKALGGDPRDMPGEIQTNFRRKEVS